MVAPDGATFLQGGEMIEVSDPHTLRFSFHWIEGGKRGPRTEISIRFAAEGAGTRMTFRQSGFADDAIRDGHSQGWQECLDRFVEALEDEGSAVA